MIPLQLKLQDFMSYAELDLDFRGIHSAVLSGANGAGKSTLLDAITYALWDRARAGAEELIRLGQAEMWVELQFEMDSQTYRVWRRRMRKKGVQSQLNFQQLGPDGNFVSLDGTTLRETQARINGVLRMGYETFVNSAFILQGRADQFTTKTPRERKAVLGEILGLQHYDDLSTRARERWKAGQSRADALEGEQADVRQALEARVETEAGLERAKEAAASLGRLLQQAQERHNRLLAEEVGLLGARADTEAAEATRRMAVDEQARLLDEMASHERQIAKARAESEQRVEIEAAHEAHDRLVLEDREHRKSAEASFAIERQLATARKVSQDAHHGHDLAIQGLEAELTGLRREQAQHLAIAEERERIEIARQQLLEARQAETDYLERAQRHRKLEERQQALEQAIQRIVLAHEASRRDRELRLARALESARNAPTVAAQLEATQAEAKLLAIAAVEQDRVKEKGFAFKAAKERAEAGIESSLGANRVLEVKLAQLAVNLGTHAGGRRDVHIERSHACPLCHTELESEQLEAVIQQYKIEFQAHEDEAARFAHEVTAAERDLIASRVRYKELGKDLERREATQEKLGQLRQQMDALALAQAEADALAQELAATSAVELPQELLQERESLAVAVAQLAHDPAALAVLQARVADLRWAEAKGWQLEQALAALERVKTQLPGVLAQLVARTALRAADTQANEAHITSMVAQQQAVGHDAAVMADVQARLEALAEAPARWTALQQRLLWLEGAAAMQARLEAERAQQALRAVELELALTGLRRKLEREPFWQGEMAAANIELSRLRDESTRRHEEVGKLESALTRLDELDKRLAAKKAEWQACIDEAQTFKELTEAFGKNGIQALVIENALPELEEEANRLLTRITDNRMHVRLVTQKEKKGGGVGETLEIYISDEVGTRNYEMYSGGEAFRVNFALRLALSRLLARRAGARLQTLVIDEGFGTQDEKGRERLIEAINAVSPEFARILVITHVRELKDAFNTHIEVSKHGGVSRVTLSA